MNYSPEVQHSTKKYRYFTYTILLLTILGIVDSLYLALSHYKNYTDISYSSFCAISKAINCDTVSQSPWSIFLGLPLAVWGILSYSFFFVLLLTVGNNKNERMSIWSILFIIVLFFSFGSIFLGYISATKIHSYCLLCLLSYGINLSITYLIWLIRRRYNRTSFFKNIKQGLNCLHHIRYIRLSIPLFIIIIFLLEISFPHYWNLKIPPSTENVKTGYTAQGYPWIGAASPILTIEEFADYQCFQCAKIHRMLRLLISKYPDKIRLIHRQYPMDNKFNQIVVPEPFHVGSGYLALAAIAAEKQNKFWILNDSLYAVARKKQNEVNLKTLAEDNGLNSEELIKEMYSQENVKKLQKDIWQGLKYKITGTPTYVIDGQVFPSVIPSHMLKKAF